MASRFWRLSCGPASLTFPAIDTAPDILWIITTQWRAQATGYAGDANARTPSLDSLAATATNYRQAVTPHPFGPFARAALLTGVPSPENGVRDYFDPLPDTARTIAHRLAERGYVTAWIGKWHLAPRPADVPLVGEAHARLIVPPERHGGFAYWEGFEGGFLLNDPWLHGSRRPAPERVPGYQADVLVDEMLHWWCEVTGAAAPASAPRFAVVSIEAPHPPYAAPAAGVTPPSPDSLSLAPNVPRGGDTESRARRELTGYYAHIEATDRALGRLVAALDEHAAGTSHTSPAILFTSVHGDMHGAHALFRKGWPQEESIRVPLLVRAPGMHSARSRPTSAAVGEVSNAPVSLLDLPAITESLADRRPWRCTRDHADISMPSVVALPHQCDRIWHGWRSPTRKRIFLADGTPWLDFDLARDPGELLNRA